MRTLFTIVATGTVLIGAFLALVYYWQSSMIFLPGIGGGSPDVLAQCGPGSAEWIEDGTYRGKACEPAGAAIGTVIIYHGNAGTVDDRAYLAAELTRRGFRAVLHEYPGYGKREGKATVRHVLGESLNDFVLAHARWPGPVYVLGESLGAGIAAQVVAKHGDKAAGLVLITPWDSLSNVVNGMFPVPLSFLLHEGFDTMQALAQYRGNIVIVSAERDEVLPVTHARALAKAIPAAAYLELPGAGHNDWPACMTAQHWGKIVAVLTTPRR